MSRKSSIVNGKKQCRECENWFPATLDYFNKAGEYLSSYCKKCCIDRAVKWWNKHREQGIEKSRIYRVNNPDKRKITIKNWKINNPDKLRIQEMIRRERELNTPFTLTTEDVKTSLDYFYYCCAYCGQDISDGFHLDHFIPVSSKDCPGTISGNIVPTCPRCNLQKRDYDPIEWITGKFPDTYEKIIRNILEYFQGKK